MMLLYRLLGSLTLLFLIPAFGMTAPAAPDFATIPDGSGPILHAAKAGTGNKAGHCLGCDKEHILYVNKTATGSDDGSSWADAIPDLADALLTAKTLNEANPGAVQQIWVAKGTYVPKYNAADGTTGDGGRDNAFVLLKDVRLYGGFRGDGSETSINDRDLTNAGHKTILSGALSSGDSTYHVVISAGDVGDATLDGFTIQEGNADTNVSISIKGQSIPQNKGGGIFLSSSSPALTNLVISSNKANQGGGMYYLYSASVLTNVIVSSNEASDGGGMYALLSPPLLTNVIITHNEARGKGGGFLNESAISAATLTNVTISHNSASQGAEWYNQAGTPIIRNAIIWGNGVAGDLYDVQYSLVQDQTNNDNYTVAGNNLPGDTDPLFRDPANGDFTLQASSPAIGAGNNSFYTDLDANTKDLAGNPRLSGAVIDMGAYEFREIPAVPDADGILYVKKDAAGNGSSWNEALSELADALLAAKTLNEGTPGAVQQIWVAQGTYVPKYNAADGTTGDGGRDNAFVLVKDVRIYGGFRGDEADTTDRNLTDPTSGTILSGALSNGDSTCHVVISAGDVGNAALDCFTIQGGKADAPGWIYVNGETVEGNTGGGICNQNSSPVLSNVIISHNMAGGGGGGGIYNENSSPVLYNVTISNNIAGGGGGGGGGGICNILSSPVLYNVIIISNIYGGGGGGGGIYNENSSPVLANVTISSNIAGGGGGGGGIYNLLSSPLLANVIITHNEADGKGGGFFNNTVSSPATLTNVTISHNSASEGAEWHNAIGTPIIRNAIIWGNGVAGDLYDTQYSLVQDQSTNENYTNAGNNLPTETNPMFKDAENGDFTLQISSPAMNAGDNSFFTGLDPDSKDLAGNPRLSGVPIDLGAYEYQLQRFTVSFNSGNGPVTDTLVWERDKVVQPADPIQPDYTFGGWYKEEALSNIWDFDEDVVTENITLHAKWISRILYVNGNNLLPAGQQDGANWETAYANLHTALAAAGAGPQKEIWVARGTYTTNTAADSPATWTQRQVYFRVPDGVALYGGFAGGEETLDARNFRANPTILSGEIGAAGPHDNSFHVLLFDAAGEETVLDGFVVQDGNANLGEVRDIVPHSEVLSTPGDDPEDDDIERGGGASFINGANVRIRHTRFERNSGVFGGGVYIGANCNPVFENCYFRANQSNFGGGVYGWHMAASFVNVLFSGNHALGGALYLNHSSPELTNATIAGNSSSHADSKAVYNYGGIPVFTSSIIWGNSGGAVTSGAVITSSIIEGGHAGSFNLDSSPAFTDPFHYGLSPTLGGDYRLSNGSPAIDKGAADAAGLPDLDLDGNPRVRNSRVDMGAYENPHATLPVTLIYFNAVISENHVQLTWQTAREVNLSHFEVQRSSDGKHFEKVAGQAPADKGSYSRSDYPPARQADGKPLYYRLKIIDNDGTFAYSNIEAVQWKLTDGHEANKQIVIYPNPTQKWLFVKGAHAGEIREISLLHNHGTELLRTAGLGGAIDISGLGTGVYLVRISFADGTRQTYKALIEK